MKISAFAISFLCFSCAVAFVFAERSRWPISRAMLKMTASTAFVLLAAECGAASSDYGRLVLTALIFCWLGDLFLLSSKKVYFLIGTAAFLFGHVAFAAAFASEPTNLKAFLIALALMTAFGAGVLYWLWNRLSGIFEFAVPVYVAAIALMSSLAIAHSAASGSMLAAAGALAFITSDISVARDRFIGRSIANYGWGLPLYYVAQVLLAISAAQMDPRSF